MARIELNVDSSASPEEVIAALTDFTDRRPDVWPGLNPEMYRVYEVGDTWADVQEGNNNSIWARERYDWSTPGTVRWTVQESSFSAPGDFVEAVVMPSRDGGSRIGVTWFRRGKTLPAKLVVGLISLLGGLPVKWSIEAGLRRVEGHRRQEIEAVRPVLAELRARIAPLRAATGAAAVSAAKILVLIDERMDQGGAPGGRAT
jgi:hypothetical protein